MYRPNLQSVALAVPEIFRLQFWSGVANPNLGEGEAVGGRGWCLPEFCSDKSSVKVAGVGRGWDGRGEARVFPVLVNSLSNKALTNDTRRLSQDAKR